MVSKYTLKSGPSREEFFDCIRLGLTAPQLSVIEFWGEYYKVGASLPIEIEGIHRADRDGRAFYFWGRRKQITSGDKWVPIWESQYVDFAFGKWDTYHRRGQIQFTEASLFQNPIAQEEEEVAALVKGFVELFANQRRQQ